MATRLWALKWRSCNEMDGGQEHLMLFHHIEGFNLFRTRAAARAFRDKHYGYIRHREDLRREPHGWRVPAIVRVEVVEVKPLGTR